MSDLSESFEKLMNSAFINYNGCLIERSGKGFIFGRKYYGLLEDVKKEIDLGLANLRKKIYEDNKQD